MAGIFGGCRCGTGHWLGLPIRPTDRYERSLVIASLHARVILLRRRLLLAFFMTLVVVTAESARSDASNFASPGLTGNTAAQEQRRLERFFDDVFERDLERSPIQAAFAGEPSGQDRWDDLSISFQEESTRLIAADLEAISRFDDALLSPSLQLSKQVFIRDRQQQLAWQEFRDEHYLVEPLWGAQAPITAVLMGAHPVNTVADAEDYITRIDAVPAYLDEVLRQLESRAAKGFYLVDWMYPQVIAVTEAVISGAPFDGSDQPSPLWEDVQEKFNRLPISSSLRDELLADAQSALVLGLAPAYRRLIDTLRRHQPQGATADGVWRFERGQQFYQMLLAFYTSTDVSADAIHALGLSEVARLHLEMQRVMTQLEFDGSLSDFFDHVRTDAALRFPDTTQGRNDYMAEVAAVIKAMEGKLPQYFGRLPEADFVVKPVESYREATETLAFYQSPSLDGRRPGIYYVNLYDMAALPRTDLEALAFHEGIPGHHLEASLALEADIPDFQRYTPFVAFSEGWGLYAESLAKEMGFYTDPYAEFGRLGMELWRATRLVVDTGIHAKGWSREHAIAYLEANTPNAYSDCVSAVERYISWPGQGTAYTLGKLRLMALRDLAQSALGQQFDIREFHDTVLANGPLPLDLLEANIKAYIAEKQARDG